MTRLVRRQGWAWWAIGMTAMLPIIVRRVGDPDYWWHELTGRLMWNGGFLARNELYTYTIPGRSWTDHEYLSQLLYHLLTRIGGLLLVSLFFAALIWVGFWLIVARTREGDHSAFVGAASIVLAAGAAVIVWGPRPQVFDFLFVSLELLLIERFLRGGDRGVYALPLITVVWANFHGGFVFVYFFLVLTVVGLAARRAFFADRSLDSQMRRLLLVTVGCGVAGLLTPYGPALLVYVWRTQFSSQLSGFVAEWASPDFHMIGLLPLEVMLLALIAGVASHRWRLHDVLLVVSTGALALHAVRFIPIFVSAATPVLIWQWSDPWRRVCERVREVTRRGTQPAWTGEALLMLLVVVTGVAIGIAAYTLHGQARATRANYPVAAADWLAANSHVGTRVYNEYSWGGYIAYRFYPSSTRRVFIYGESELMGDELLAEYADVNQLKPDWEHVLDSNGVDYVVFPSGRPLDAALSTSKRWQRVYIDGVASIFVRTPTELAPR